MRFSFFSDICSCSQSIKGQITGLLKPLAESYLKIYQKQKQCVKLKRHKKEEFFGLRDFYRYISLISSYGYLKFIYVMLSISICLSAQVTLVDRQHLMHLCNFCLFESSVDIRGLKRKDFV